MKILKIDFR